MGKKIKITIEKKLPRNFSFSIDLNHLTEKVWVLRCFSLHFQSQRCDIWTCNILSDVGVRKNIILCSIK